MLNAENRLDAEQKRLAWRCRRGMLELDIVLQRFVNQAFYSLNLAELEVFDDMLELPDNDFWTLLSGGNLSKKDQVFATLIAKINAVQHHQQEAQ